jgi:hypothetical protein
MKEEIFDGTKKGRGSLKSAAYKKAERASKSRSRSRIKLQEM